MLSNLSILLLSMGQSQLYKVCATIYKCLFLDLIHLFFKNTLEGQTEIGQNLRKGMLLYCNFFIEVRLGG